VEDSIPVLLPAARSLGRLQRITKRGFDLILALILIAVSWPLMALTACAVWLEGTGPILFRQQRVGQGGRLFTMVKFRTMYPGAEDQPPPGEPDPRAAAGHKRADDPRVTPLGRLLRRSSLDELPQLFNVLKGEMSLVGPRPELPWLVARYEPWQYQRLAVPQGITGLWQISGRSRRPLHLSTGVDLEYVERCSLWLDVVILLKTPLAVLQGDGAY
jgi:lipopolysaccharide/colanic/teichoic acid biosynthesis glycosyltransferase